MKTRNFTTIMVIILSLLLLLTHNSCKKDEEDQNPTPPSGNLETIVSEKTFIIDSTQFSEPIIEGDKYTFTYTGQQPDIKSGDIIVGQTGDGYMRSVNNIDFSNSQMEIITEQALLSDVIEQCEIYDSIQLKIGEKSTFNGQPVQIQTMEMLKGVQIKNGLIDLTNVVLYSGNYNGVDIEAKISQGYIQFEPTFYRKLKIQNGQVEIFKLIARGDIEFVCDIEVTCDGQVNYIPEIPELFNMWVGPFFFGPVPAFIKLSFTPGLEINLNVDGYVSKGFEAYSFIEFGAEYTQESGWQKVNNKSFDLSDHPIDWSANGGIYAKGWVRPQIDLKLAGVLGPYMYVDPYLNFNGQLDYPVWQWDLNAGIEGYLGFDVSLFGWQLVNYYSSIYEWETNIANDQGTLTSNQSPNASFEVDPTTGNTNTLFEFNASSCSDLEDPTSSLLVRWDFNGDGIWDTDWETDKIKNFQFSTADTYNVKLEVKDSGELTDIETKSVTVTQSGNISNYNAIYSSSTPTIDGQVNTSEWINANSYIVTYTRYDGAVTSEASLFLQHDNTWLYVGIKTEFDEGWDVYHSLRFDGNNDHILNGNSPEPYTDIQINQGSPNAWSGYNYYYYINGTNAVEVTQPTGTEKNSYGSTNVNYEYKIKLSDLTASVGQTIGFFMRNGTDGTNDYEFPTNGIINNPSEWAHIILEN